MVRLATHAPDVRLALGAAALLAACSAPEVRQVWSDGGVFHVAVATDPDPAVTGEVVLDVVITDDQGPWCEAEVGVVATMEAHGHGSAEPLGWIGDGAYEGTIALSMSGRWSLVIEAATAEVYDRAQLSLDVH